MTKKHKCSLFGKKKWSLVFQWSWMIRRWLCSLPLLVKFAIFCKCNNWMWPRLAIFWVFFFIFKRRLQKIQHLILNLQVVSLSWFQTGQQTNAVNPADGMKREGVRAKCWWPLGQLQAPTSNISSSEALTGGRRREKKQELDELQLAACHTCNLLSLSEQLEQLEQLVSEVQCIFHHY